MLDPKRVKDAEAKGVAFICRMCIRWYEGEDQGLLDVDGETRCAAKGRCSSPIGGGVFEEYSGPLAGYLTHNCYICGASNPEKALEPKMVGTRRIGCCADCFDNQVKKLAERPVGRKIIFTTAKRAGPEKFEAIG